MVRRADLAVRVVVVVVGSGMIAVDTLADLAVTAAIAEDLVVVVGLVGLATGTGIAEEEDSVDGESSFSPGSLRLSAFP